MELQIPHNFFHVSGTGSYVMGNLSEETTYFYNISSSNSFTPR